MKILEPTSKIEARLGIQEDGPVQKIFTNECYRHMRKYVVGGEDSSINREVILKADEIIYNHPGAHYQYIGKLYVDPEYQKGAFYNEDYGFWSRPGITKIPTSIDLNTPLGGSYWDKNMWAAEKDEIVESVQKFIDGGK